MGAGRRIWRLCVWGIVLFGFSGKGGILPKMKSPVSKHYFLFVVIPLTQPFRSADS